MSLSPEYNPQYHLKKERQIKTDHRTQGNINNERAGRESNVRQDKEERLGHCRKAREGQIRNGDGRSWVRVMCSGKASWWQVGSIMCLLPLCLLHTAARGFTQSSNTMVWARNALQQVVRQ